MAKGQKKKDRQQKVRDTFTENDETEEEQAERASEDTDIVTPSPPLPLAKGKGEQTTGTHGDEPLSQMEKAEEKEAAAPVLTKLERLALRGPAFEGAAVLRWIRTLKDDPKKLSNGKPHPNPLTADEKIMDKFHEYTKQAFGARPEGGLLQEITLAVWLDIRAKV